MRKTGTLPCDLCGVETRRNDKDSKLCDTCHLAIERFFILYFTKYKLRMTLPREIIELMAKVVRSILEDNGVIRPNEYIELDNDEYLNKVIADSPGRAAKLREHKTKAASNSE